MSSRIFGFTDNAPLLDITSIAFTGIVAYLVFSDHILSRLNEAARDSCYSDMIQHLYKDLTITGVLSFALAILLGTDSFRASEHVIYLVCLCIFELGTCYCSKNIFLSVALIL